jgi:hypothetical protein
MKSIRRWRIAGKDRSRADDVSPRDCIGALGSGCGKGNVELLGRCRIFRLLGYPLGSQRGSSR